MENKENIEILFDQDFINRLKEDLLEEGIIQIDFFYFKFQYGYIRNKMQLILYHLARDKKVKINFWLDEMFSIHKINKFGYYISKKEENSKKYRKLRQKNELFFEIMKGVGAVVYFTRPLSDLNKKFIPFALRDHRKVIIIHKKNGDKIAYFGSTNWNKKLSHDFMIRVSDNDLANKIYDVNLNYSKYKDDIIFEHGEDRYYLDIGNPFRSRTYIDGMKMIWQAKEEIIYVKQMPPEPDFLFMFAIKKILNPKMRIICITPHTKDHHMKKFPYSIALWLFNIFKFIFGFEHYYTKKRIHMKILMKDNKELLCGSHNLSIFGVIVGTIEFSSVLKDINIIEKTKKYLFKIVKSN
ncbi:MAG: hypothetical protein N3A71_03580 [Candidatus Dojkabacteria bacterium]|nr:hypothetical protein [Candidatus Dojkabacteria bacterium]